MQISPNRCVHFRLKRCEHFIPPVYPLGTSVWDSLWYSFLVVKTNEKGAYNYAKLYYNSWNHRYASAWHILWEIWNLLTGNNKRITHRWCEPLTPLTWERGSVYPKCAWKSNLLYFQEFSITIFEKSATINSISTCSNSKNNKTESRLLLKVITPLFLLAFCLSASVISCYEYFFITVNRLSDMLFFSIYQNLP